MVPVQVSVGAAPYYNGTQRTIILIISPWCANALLLCSLAFGDTMVPQSADLGGRVGWLPKAERVKTLFLSLIEPQNARGVGSRLRSPPGPHLRSSRFSRHPRLRQAPARRFAKNRERLGKRPGPQAPWRPGPQAPGAWIPPLTG